MKIISIGSDPEFFIVDKENNPYPVTPFAEGSKDNPKPIESLGPGFFEQRDNVSFEGNIPPAKTKEEFVRNITLLRNYFASKVEKHGFTISNNGVEYFPKRMLQSSEAMEFGCSTIKLCWSCYNGWYPDIPTPILSNYKFRVSGFHIHLGLDHDSLYDNMRVLVSRLFDVFVTIPSYNIKNEQERLFTYGQLGSARFKDYGVECRTLSTFFTQEQWLPWVWDQIMKIELFINQCSIDDLKKLTRSSIYITLSTSKTSLSSWFSCLNNIEILKDFEETKIYYNGAFNKKNCNKPNHYYSYNTSTSTF